MSFVPMAEEGDAAEQDQVEVEKRKGGLFQVAINFLLNNLKSKTTHYLQPKDELSSDDSQPHAACVRSSYFSSEQNFGPVSGEITILALPS